MTTNLIDLMLAAHARITPTPRPVWYANRSTVARLRDAIEDYRAYRRAYMRAWRARRR